MVQQLHGHFSFVTGDSDFDLASASVRNETELMRRAVSQYEAEFPKVSKPQPSNREASDNKVRFTRTVNCLA